MICFFKILFGEEAGRGVGIMTVQLYDDHPLPACKLRVSVFIQRTHARTQDDVLDE